METTQSNPRIQDAHVWYDEKQKRNYIFCAIDGKEMTGKVIWAVEAAKVRDGITTPEEIAAKYYKAMLDRPVKTENLETKRQNENTESLTQGQRFKGAAAGLGTNFANNMEGFSAWITDILNNLWNNDRVGAYKEFAKGVDYAEEMVQNTLRFLHVEDGVSRLRNYMLATYDAGDHLLKGDVKGAGEAMSPLTDDIKKTADFLFVRSGLKNLVEGIGRNMPVAGKTVQQFVTGNQIDREAAKMNTKIIWAETGADMKAVLHSESAQKTVEGVLKGMEKLESETKRHDDEVKKQNTMREDDLDVKHPRLSNVRIYANSSGLEFFIRCKIDGVQQMGKMLNMQDLTKWEKGALDRFQLAEKYYAKDLAQNMDEERVVGMGR